jgi:hypothetical protein
MKQVSDLLPWKMTDISVYPYGTDLWSMNPSIDLDSNGTWRCVARIVDYCMPSGRTVRSPKAGPGHQTKNAMIILDPATWKPIQIFKMRERDEYPRVASANVGFEDMRIFRTDRGGLQGIAASLHLKRDTKAAAGGAQHQPPEQAMLSFDAEFNIVKSKPIRGDFSGTAQKNWSPFTGCAEQRFLYSINGGVMFDDSGRVHGDAAMVRPSRAARPLGTAVEPLAEQADPGQQAREALEWQVREKEQHEQEQRAKHERKEREHAEKAKPDLRTRVMVRGTETAQVRGRRVSHDTVTSRPSQAGYGAALVSRGMGTRLNTESVRTLGTGRALMPKYEGLRGGTQLVRVADNTWLGIGHEMSYISGLKNYWHHFYAVNDSGKLTAISQPCKLALEGIEFAAGMAIDGDRVVVSFGVDDMHCRLGETSLSAVMGILRPVDR